MAVLFAKRKLLGYGREMSSVGFIPRTESELEQLRAAYQSLNDLLKNLTAAEACLKNFDLKLTGDHLKVAQWNAREARKRIEAIGREKATKERNNPSCKS